MVLVLGKLDRLTKRLKKDLTEVLAVVSIEPLNECLLDGAAHHRLMYVPLHFRVARHQPLPTALGWPSNGT